MKDKRILEHVYLSLGVIQESMRPNGMKSMGGYKEAWRIDPGWKQYASTVIIRVA